MFKKSAQRLALVITIGIAAACTNSSYGDWDIYTVDDGNTAVSMDMDSSNTMHLCYFGPVDDDAPLGATGTLRYARSSGDAGTWATETVTTLIEEGSWCDIAVGTDGIVRIVFIAGDTLYYTHNTGGTWSTEIIVETDIMWRCAIDLDSSNTPHVIFSRYQERETVQVQYLGSPFYATRTTLGWQEQILNLGIGGAEYLIDSAQWLDIAARHDDTIYMTWKSAWVTMFMFPLSHDPDSFGGAQPGIHGGANRLEIDANGYFYIAATDPTGGTISLGENTSTPGDSSWYFNWRTWDLDNNLAGMYEETGHHLALAVDSDGNKHLAYYDANSDNANYLWLSSTSITGTGFPPQTLWQHFTEVIESDGDIGQSIDIAIDSSGDPHVAFLDTTNGTVRCGKRYEFTGSQLRVSPMGWNYEYGYLYPYTEDKEIYISNPGTENLVITSITATDTSSAATTGQPVWTVKIAGAQRPLGTLPATVAPGDFATFAVSFSPDVFGTNKRGEVEIESNWGSVVIYFKGMGMGGDPPSDHCFIATAAYGSKFADDVVVFRRFRDHYLLPNPIGRQVVKLYYKLSPPLAAFIAQNEDYRRTVRECLNPVARCMEYTLPQVKQK